MSTFLLILFVVALALAPLAHFVPSKHQRRIAGLREYAALQGLFVEFRSPPTALPAAAGLYRRGSTIYYGLRLATSRRGEPDHQVWIRRDEQWRPTSGTKPCPAVLLSLPGDVFVVSIDSQSCGIYWHEAGEQGEIDEIVRVLKGIVAELAG